jgi:hypothetical protein
MVEVSIPRKTGTPAAQPLSTVVSQETWDLVLKSSRDFDQQLVRELPEHRNQQDPGCLHGWLVVVEAVDAARMDQNVFGQEKSPATIRRDAENACVGGLANKYAFELARLAREQLRECGSLGAEDIGDDAIFLATCARLGGDRMAAGDAYLFMEKLTERMDEARMFGRDELGSEFFAASAKDLAATFNTALKNCHIYVYSTHAPDVDHATVDGRAEFRTDDEGYAAEIRLELVRQFGHFVVLSYKLSDKRRIR